MQPLSTGATAEPDAARPPVLLGGRWAFALGATLLALLAASVGSRWLNDPQRHGNETVVQQPITNTPSSPRQEPPTPDDPGDNP